MVRLTFAAVFRFPDVAVIGKFVVPVTVTLSVPELEVCVLGSPR